MPAPMLVAPCSLPMKTTVPHRSTKTWSLLHTLLNHVIMILLSMLVPSK